MDEVGQEATPARLILEERSERAVVEGVEEDQREPQPSEGLPLLNEALSKACSHVEPCPGSACPGSASLGFEPRVAYAGIGLEGPCHQLLAVEVQQLSAERVDLARLSTQAAEDLVGLGLG